MSSFHEPDTALRRVLETTEAMEVALAPLDVEAFARALAARAQALDVLGAQASQTPGALFTDSVKTLAATVAEADRRVRGRAHLALAGLREELLSLDSGRQGLAGYRPPAPNLPRFSDQRG